jgi:hypothetical protein
LVAIKKSLSVLSLFHVAIFTVDRASFTGLKGNGGLYAALGTGYGEHLSRLLVFAEALFSPGCPAFGTTGGVVLQTVRLVELLLTDTEDELLPAVTTYEGLVFQSHLLLLLIFC